ncbi:Ku protein [Methylovirgula sp. HY1]|uniref:non-homologous end joining protein Ku n=1 Tax=Methylovirgula sp. HY1 TaxID=2822761 RepID=UPI001C5B8045|nr:Ku protein [Methylovirgula sp. HY1]
MALISFWKGYLKLSLVTCPVAMTPAFTQGEKIRFHTLNRATGHRVQARYIDAETDQPVEPDAQVKGYQTDDGVFIPLEDEELGAVALESTRTIDLKMFVPKDSVEWIWYDQPYFLLPDDSVGEEAFAVIRQAMAATGTVGISRLVLYRCERALLLEPRDRGIVVWTLRYGDEIRDQQAYFDGIKTDVEPKLLSLVTTLIEKNRRAWDPTLVRDPVQEQLLDIIASKKKGKRFPKAEAHAATPGNVVNILDALRKSLKEEKDTSNGGQRR